LHPAICKSGEAITDGFWAIWKRIGIPGYVQVDNGMSFLGSPPRHRLKKPTTGRYHLVRLIRSDMKINIFGELFPVPPELKLEYVVVT